MIIGGMEEPTTTAQHFVERYGITPRFFMSCCLLPSLLAVRTVSCSYRGTLVETPEVPAWKARLRALRTVLALGEIQKIAERRTKIPLGVVPPTELGAIAEGFLESDCHRVTADFLVRECLKPALDAVNTTLLFYRGQMVDSLQTKDWHTQFQALTIAARLHRLYPGESDNTHFATYGDVALLVSEPRRESRTIEIVRKTQLVQLR